MSMDLHHACNLARGRSGPKHRAALSRTGKILSSYVCTLEMSGHLTPTAAPGGQPGPVWPGLLS